MQVNIFCRLMFYLFFEGGKEDNFLFFLRHCVYLTGVSDRNSSSCSFIFRWGGSLGTFSTMSNFKLKGRVISWERRRWWGRMLFTQSLTSAWNLWITEATKKKTSSRSIHPSIHSKSHQLILLKEKKRLFSWWVGRQFRFQGCIVPNSRVSRLFFLFFFFSKCFGSLFVWGTVVLLPTCVRDCFSRWESRQVKGKTRKVAISKLYPSSRVTWQRWVAHSSFFFVLFFNSGRI